MQQGAVRYHYLRTEPWHWLVALFLLALVLMEAQHR